MSSRTITIERTPRSCDCCGCDVNDLESLWNYEWTGKTRDSRLKFQVSNVICKQCGFTFTSPCSSEESLRAYYADSLPASDYAKETYNTERRIVLINRHREESSVFADIGAGKRSPFHEALEKYFDKVLLIELKRSVNTDYRSTGELADSTADMLSHYFVLEHVPNVRGFFPSAVAS